MPKEYIERELAINATKHAWAKGLEPTQYIEIIPAADVAPVVHGRWLGTHDGWYYSYSCSECGAEALTKEETMHDQVCSAYCFNCGAKMDGVL